MNREEWAQVGKVAQDGFTRLQQEIEAQGASEPEALTILLGIAQLKAHAAVAEQPLYPSDELVPSNDLILPRIEGE